MNPPNRRRHAEEDDDFEAKRRRAPPAASELEKRIVDLIRHVGDKTGGTSLESNLEGLVALLEQDLEKHGPRIIEAVTECAKHLPDKLTVYSTLVGLLNAKNYNFGGEIVEKIVNELQETLDKAQFRHACNLITFVCDLGNCRVLSLTSVIEFLEGLLEAASQEGVPQVRSDWFVFSILRSLPWIGAELNEKKKEELQNLMSGIDNYVQQRDRRHVNMLRVWSASTPHEQEEYLECLLAQIKQLSSAAWQEKHISRLYVAFDATLVDALQHNLPTLTPPPHSAQVVYPLPWVVFRLFDYADCPEDGPVLPGVHSIERFLVEDELGWIIDLNELNRKDCAEALLNYVHKAKVPLAYVILETIFGRLFQLPASPQPGIFYGSLLIEMCRMQPNTLPQVLAQAAELLYERSETMQPECLDRFVDWFSYHLSNFQYRWSWQDWVDCLEADDFNSKLCFAREVVQKCMRFAYYERMVEILPATHSRLLPSKPDIQYPYSDEDSPEAGRARHFQELFQAKISAEDMIGELRPAAAEGEEEEKNAVDFDPEAFSVFFAVLLKLASKSFSHNFAALTRYHRTLKEVAGSNEEIQQVLLATLFKSWHSNQQMMLVLVDKLLKMQILDVAVVIEWVFEGLKDEHGRQWVWEALNGALSKLSKHVAKCKRDLEEMVREAEKKKEERKKKEEDGNEDGDDAKMEEEGNEEGGDFALDAKKAEVESLVETQKNVFLDVMLKFAVNLSMHEREATAAGESSVSPWFNLVVGRLRQVFLQHQSILLNFTSVMDESIFSNPEISSQVVKVFQEFQALRN